MREISQIATTPCLWNIAMMAKQAVKPGVSARLEDMLMSIKPADLSARQWCIQSDVSTSFFTDLRKGVEPGIDKIERLAAQAGLSLAELLEGPGQVRWFPQPGTIAALIRPALPALSVAPESEAVLQDVAHEISGALEHLSVFPEAENSQEAMQTLADGIALKFGGKIRGKSRSASSKPDHNPRKHGHT